MANRGEIARRVIRTCRDMTIETVAVYADPDRGEPHVGEADQAVRLPGSSPIDTYLDIDAILRAAKESGADAIHPGYGFLSESPDFARAVGEAGLIWIGPPAKAIATMGSKLASKALAESAGVPVLPSIDLTGLDDDAAVAAANEIGFPVLVKASAGGGGKGMRIVRSSDDLVAAIAGARREAGAAFGDDTVFLERYLEAPRHIEIQVIADNHGNVASLHERECSIQRRHQKVIEEAPSIAIDSTVRQRMGEAAVALARGVGYTGAGTVEFLFHDGEFWFLEMNTRLQVEHPVTEMITGIDLVRLQIEIADGGRLQEQVLQPKIEGHAIEARLYAEDPAHDYLPMTGTVHQFSFPAAEGLRVDSGVENGSEISTYYDPMLAKVIAHAPTRGEAAAVLAGALRRAVVHGPTTNRDLLVRILENEDFIAGRVDTHFLDERELTMPLVDRRRGPKSGDRGCDRRPQSPATGGCRAGLDSGWLAQRPDQRPDERLPPRRDGTGRRVPGHPGRAPGDRRGGGRNRVGIAGACGAGGRRGDAELTVHRVGAMRYVDGPSGSVTLEAVPRFRGATVDEAPGSLHAPMPGRVVRVEVAVGDTVTEGQVLMVLEAMKMEHTLRAPMPGTVQTVNAAAGEQVGAGSVLVVVAGTQASTLG